MMKHKKRSLKEDQIGVRFTAQEKERIEQRARERDMSASEHLRDLARRDLEQSQNGQAA